MLLIYLGISYDSVQKDLLNYVNIELPVASSLEDAAIKVYENVTGDNYKNDKEVYSTIKYIVLPCYEQFIERLEAIRPETDELKEVHELYIKAAKAQHNAFMLAELAISNGSDEMINRANEKIEEAKNDLKIFRESLDNIESKHKIKITVNE
jgi:hypothetical protein